MRIFIYFLALAFMVGIASSCSDDDDNLKSNQFSQEEAYDDDDNLKNNQFSQEEAYDDDDNLKSNQLSQEEAYELAKEKLSEFSLDEIDIYVYPQTLPANTKVESAYTNNEIKTPTTEFWFFFVDEHPDANWTHSCQYIFVDAKSHVSVVKGDWVPDTPSIGEMEIINMSTFTQNSNPHIIYPNAETNTRAARTSVPQRNAANL